MELSERNIRQLESEAFSAVYEVFDEPNEVHSMCSHPSKKTMIITEGSMRVMMEGQSKMYTVGNRVDIPQNVTHTVMIDKEGCKYVVGE